MVHLILSRFLVHYLIDSKPKSVIKHSGNQLAKESAGTLDARIFIDFKQPHLLIVADKVVKSKQSKQFFRW